jgi:glycosyltransferase involved in cell wall biosynthesis
VVPSRAEPFGRVVIEAFAAGVPVVGSAVGGIRETVRHEQTGLLVPYGDDEQLAQAILRLLGDVRLRERLVAEARRQAEAEYRQDVYQDTIAAIAEEALGTLRPALLPQAGGT